MAEAGNIGSLGGWSFIVAQKNLISGVPMANIIFAPSQASSIILPRIFHQSRLLTCPYLARRWGAKDAAMGK
ncbi:MAG: bile acid:sodium symporter [Deltaproteobacteria bacterium]|nr:bile acid:sodium symporter [Deltaproteobacteria bacterium]